MPEVKYKFKSSLAFETVQFSESTITVGQLKELINKKQPPKTNGFDLKFKDCNGRVYSNDEETIDINCKIIVSRSPKLIKPVPGAKKIPIKDSSVVVKEVPQIINNVTLKVDQTVKIDIPNAYEESEITTRVEAPITQITKTVTAIPNIPEFLKCSLCHKIMKDATTIHCCKKNFCYECITGYLFDPDISGSMECPECKCTVSNYAANVTQNTKLRDMISDFENGKFDSNSCHVLDESCISEALSHKDISSEPIKTETSSPRILTDIDCDNLNGSNGHLQDVNIDNDTNLYDDHLLNQISVTEVFDYQVQSSLTETSARSVPDREISPDINDCRQLEETSIYDDKLADDEGPSLVNSSDNNVIQCDSHIIPDVKWNSATDGPRSQSIKDMDFDPVLYMKFLKIVGENYPDELRKILSNNNIEGSHGRDNEDRRSTGSRHRSREDEYRDKGKSKKRSREDDTSEGSRHKKMYSGQEKRPVEDRARYEESEQRKKSSSNHHGNASSISTIINSSTNYNGGNMMDRSRDRFPRKNNGGFAPVGSRGGSQKRYRSRSREPELGRDGRGEGRMEGRDGRGEGRDGRIEGRDCRDGRGEGRDYYQAHHQHQSHSSSARYARPHDSQPLPPPPPLHSMQYNDDRRTRPRNDYPPMSSSSYRSVKNKYDRR